MPFHVHDVDGQVDEDFRKVFLKNVFMANDSLLPIIYNVYSKNHANKVNLLGVGEMDPSITVKHRVTYGLTELNRYAFDVVIIIMTILII